MIFSNKAKHCILILALVAIMQPGCAKRTPSPTVYKTLPELPASVRERQKSIPPILKKKINQPTVRIGLATDKTSITLSCNKLYYLLDPTNQEKLGKLKSYQKVQLKVVRDGIRIYGPKGNLAFDGIERVLLGSDKDNSWFSLDGKRYRGFIEVIRKDASKMIVVNELEIEDYLRGVVPKEIGKITMENVEAAKTQAVAARTYTFAKFGLRADLGFDLYGNIRDQVYGGMDAEQPLIDQAISSTSGLVATYNNKFIEAYFSSTCGGATANVENTWSGGKKIPYLRSINDSRSRNRINSQSFCKASPHYRWTETWTRSQLEASLRKNLAKYSNLRNSNQLGTLRNIAIIKKDSSGRNIIMRIITSTGSYDVRGDKIRRVLCRPGTNNILRSTRFDIELVRNSNSISTIIARGGGNGHGVGMCQWGAMGMALLGYTYEQILIHYYPGTQFKYVYNN